jgi:hypothetical protein
LIVGLAGLTVGVFAYSLISGRLIGARSSIDFSVLVGLLIAYQAIAQSSNNTRQSEFEDAIEAEVREVSEAVRELDKAVAALRIELANATKTTELLYRVGRLEQVTRENREALDRVIEKK